MNCKGQFTTTVLLKNISYSLQIFVVEGQTDNLLGRVASLPDESGEESGHHPATSPSGDLW